MSKNDPKTTSCMASLTKVHNPQQKKFFFRVQTQRLDDLFEPLNSSLAQSAEELRHWWVNWQLLVLGRNIGTIYS